MSLRQFLAAALCLTGGVGTAQARDVDVQWSVTIGTPVYAQPNVWVAQPAPVYFRAVPVYIQPEPAYQPHGHWSAGRWQAGRWQAGRWQASRWQASPWQPSPWQASPRQVSRWDRDADGIPNRQDRLYNPRWDRDGDGIPNRHDDHDDHDDHDEHDDSQRGEFRGGGAHRPDRHTGQGRYRD